MRTRPGIAWRDALLPGALAALAVAELVLLDAPGRVPAGVLLVGACALLLLRTRWPLATTGSGLLALGVPWVGPELDEVATIALLLVVASYALARWVGDLRGVAGVAVILAGTALTYAVVDERDHGADDAVLVLALAVPPYVAGRFARRLADHNALLRREQELLRRQAVRDERDRVSRELHDLVAHSISAMVVQVAAAEDLLVTDPARAEEMLDRAADAGRAALAETGRLLRLLRDSDNELGLAPASVAGEPGELVGGPAVSAAEQREAPIRVAVADDQDLVRSGLELLLETRGCAMVGSAADGRQAVELVRRTRPDVVLMDIRMPVLDGIAATREITASGLDTRVLVLTTYDLDAYVYEALRAGAAGFLLKATPPDRLVEGVRTVAAGEALLAPSLTRRLIEEHVRRPPRPRGVPEPLRGLTERELEVFDLIARGLSNDDIAERLVVSQATVKTHVNRVITKLGGRTRPQLVVLGYECGWVQPGGG